MRTLFDRVAVLFPRANLLVTSYSPIFRHRFRPVENRSCPEGAGFRRSDRRRCTRRVSRIGGGRCAAACMENGGSAFATVLARVDDRVEECRFGGELCRTSGRNSVDGVPRREGIAQRQSSARGWNTIGCRFGAFHPSCADADATVERLVRVTAEGGRKLRLISARPCRVDYVAAASYSLRVRPA